MSATRTYTLEIEVEVKITSYGAPATEPTYSSGGEPPEGPEFEVESYTVGKVTATSRYENGKHSIALTEVHKSKIISDEPIQDWLMEAIDEAIIDQAAMDDWSPPDEGDYFEMERSP